MEKVQTKKIIRGTVVTDSNDKTVIVDVVRVKTHPLYRKKYTINKRYQAHDENNQYKIGDVVEIIASKPFSKTKKFIAINKVN